ncbi:MAG: hypothetical protein Q4F51_07965, partial [Sarcina sp.]|nr:hypothetical protein [Sarcina sp.]
SVPILPTLERKKKREKKPLKTRPFFCGFAGFYLNNWIQIENQVFSMQRVSRFRDGEGGPVLLSGIMEGRSSRNPACVSFTGQLSLICGQDLRRGLQIPRIRISCAGQAPDGWIPFVQKIPTVQ